MSFKKTVPLPAPIRQNSSSMISPFSKHYFGIDKEGIVKPKQLVQRQNRIRKPSMLGSNLNTHWFKSIDTDNSVLTDNEYNSSSDSLHDSALILHSAKTVHSSPTNGVTSNTRRFLDVQPHCVISKSGDARFRKKNLLGDVDVNRPTTVGPTREIINVANKDDVAIEDNVFTLRVNTLTKSGQQGDNKDLYAGNNLIAKSVDPLPPIRPALFDTQTTHEHITIHSKDNYFQKSEEKLVDNEIGGLESQTERERVIINGFPSTTTHERGDGITSTVTVTSAQEIRRQRLDSYRSITPLSLCDVITDVDNRSVNSDFSAYSVSISDSEEYDTDIEVEKDFGKAEVAPKEDMNICRWVYRQQCKKLDTSPQKQILKGLAERSLSLRNRSLGPKAIPPLCHALKDNLRVERLNLDGTDVTDDGIHHVAEMMLENITIFQLNLANNNLGLRASQAISHVMIATENLTHLNLSGNKLDNHGSWYLSAGIGANTSITHLYLSYNDFGEQGGVLLGTGIARNTKLVVLNLSWNKMCGKGAVAIFQALMVNHVLEVLDISWNGLGYDGAVALSKCMKVNKSLMDIDVSNNRLDWRCGFLLAEGLTVNSKVQKLKVGHNPLTTTGCMDVLEAVAAEGSTINLLDCSGITVVGEADLLAATISRRRKFQFIHGGIVTTHDKVGEKPGREINPMVRIIEYLRMLGLRPLELMKSFDKSTGFELPRKEFIEQIKKIGVTFQPYEIDALANSVSGKGYNKNVINYRKLSMAVREVVQAERERKLREREEWMQIKSYHENILRKGQIDYSRNSSKIADKDSLRAGGVQTGSGYFGTSIESVSSMTRLSHQSKVQLSMCSPLESSRSIIYTPKKRKKRVKKRKDTK